MKDKAHLDFMDTVYTLDGKEFTSFRAIQYLRDQGFEAREALNYLKVLREEAKLNQVGWSRA